MDAGLVRAAQHMIEAYGGRAATIAQSRSDNACDLSVVRRWRVIAMAIGRLQDGAQALEPAHEGIVCGGDRSYD